MFLNRQEAGEKLAEKLEKYKKDKGAVILAIPKGGVLVGAVVAKILNLPLDLIIVRKLPMPDNPEAGIGAISETGEIVWQPQRFFYHKEIIEEILKKQKEEIKKRIEVLREGKDLPNLKGKIVILIDDGIAMGSTIEAAIKTVKKEGAKKIVVATSVGGKEVIKKIKNMVEEMICLKIPKYFYAVAQVYKNWYDVSDEEAIKTLKKLNKKN